MAEIPTFVMPFDKDYLECIGHITTTASFNDYLIDTIICGLLDTTVDRGRIALNKIQVTPRKCEIVTTLLHMYTKNQPAIDLWAALSRQITKNAERRADITHGLWHTDKKGVWHVFRYKMRDKGKGTQIKMDLEELVTIKQALSKITEELIDWIVQFQRQALLPESMWSLQEKYV
jgi:hypothetical protein